MEQLTLKKIDLLLQLIAICVGIFLRITSYPVLFNIYFSLGIVQFTSMFVNLYFRKKWYRSRDRRSYEKFIFYLSILSSISACVYLFQLENTWVYMIPFLTSCILLASGTVLGIYYFGISLSEFFEIRKLAK